MPKPKRRTRSKRVVLIALMVLVAGVLVDWPQTEPYFAKAYDAARPLVASVSSTVGGWFDRTPKQTAQKPPAPVPVGAVEARSGDFPVVLTGLGTVQAYNTVLVRTRVDGQVIALHFTEGQMVKAGDLLVEIDPRPFQATLDQAKAKKQQDEANLENAKRDLARYQALSKNDFATRQQLDTQSAQVAQQTAQIAADQAAIESAETQLSYTSVRAPISGRTGFRLVDQGNIVNTSSQSGIVSIAQVEPISIVFTAPEDSVPQIAAGLKAGQLGVEALTSDGAQSLARGTLETLNNEIDTATGTIRLKAKFENKDHALWPGLSVVTRLTVSTRKDVVIVPAPAIQHGPSGLYVYIVKGDNKVDLRPVKVAQSNDESAVIADGVKPGERVVVSGQYRLQQDTLVAVNAPSAGQQTSQRD